MIEILKALIAGVTSVLVVLIPYMYAKNRKKSKKSRETLKKHGIFETIAEYKTLKIPHWTTGNPLKDKVMKTYALTLLNIYNTEITNYVNNISPDVACSCVQLHCAVLDKFREELAKANLPQIFLERMEEAISAATNSANQQILAVQAKELTFYDSIDETLDKIKVMIGLILEDLIPTITRMNGELEKELKK